MARLRLGDLLISAGLISQEQLEFALREQQRTGVRLGRLLVDHGMVDEMSMYDALARASNMERLDFNQASVDPEAAANVNGEWSLQHGVIPLQIDRDARRLTVAITDPTNISLLDELAFRSGFRIHTVLGSETEVQRLVRNHFYHEPLNRQISNSRLGPYSGRVRIDASEIIHGMEAMREDLHAPEPALPTAQHVSDDDHKALEQLKPLFDAQQETARALQVIFQLCMERGIIQYQEYLDRLSEMPDD